MRQLSKDWRKLLASVGVKDGNRWGKGRLGTYPPVMSEDATLDAILAGRSIARYGDGELRLAVGGDCVSQRERSDGLRRELVRILAEPGSCLVGIPNVYSKTPKLANWLSYATEQYCRMYAAKEYGSAFISRPDSAPWINREDYWDKMKGLWRGKDVTLVLGTERSLAKGRLVADGARVREVWGPRTNAYRLIDSIQEEIGKPSGPVLLCLGPTATVLAWRLAQRGVWALDLGHLGMFMPGGKGHPPSEGALISPGYQRTIREMHATTVWGTSGQKYAEAVRDFAAELGATSVLDYGSGRETLRERLEDLAPGLPVACYDPGVPGREEIPEPAELVVCTDVMEHVEEDRVPAVLDNLRRLGTKGAFFSIAFSYAKPTLPDGRNVHITVKPRVWWEDRIRERKGWQILRIEDRGKHGLFWVKKQ